MPRPMNLPNLITIARIVMVPLTIWLILIGRMDLALAVFLLAGISDGIDGFIAKRFNMRTELGAFLDPVADKLLLISIYVTLAIVDALPAWLAIIVVSRDVLIVGGVVLAWLLDHPMEMRPLVISKINTAVQIAFAGLYLLFRTLGWPTETLIFLGAPIVAAFTVISGALYVRDGLRHMSEG
ncbi:CDP-alcohol phosphatidyltransferase family protein [Thermopetrobacter sp. TC1]|uniref:CDP-alcohol phosphatidyltransferase family protein n=1 Tax=Thermopetrobacter sp. TC1 TaxID=1495045 RepID=UPI001E4922E9|nr:CDP-alcohol phosphatidyltransferase family protein [Thermopetrobacter sp. TC1]